MNKLIESLGFVKGSYGKDIDNIGIGLWDDMYSMPIFWISYPQYIKKREFNIYVRR